MMRVVIGDSVEKDRNMLVEMVSQSDGLVLEGQAKNAAEFLFLIQRVMPQIIFLCTDLPGLELSSFLQSIDDTNRRAFLILISPMETFPREEMEVFAFHRLFKPLNSNQVTATIRQIRKAIASFEHFETVPGSPSPVKARACSPQMLIVHSDGDLMRKKN